MQKMVCVGGMFSLIAKSQWPNGQGVHFVFNVVEGKRYSIIDLKFWCNQKYLTIFESVHSYIHWGILWEVFALIAFCEQAIDYTCA